jgi:hypothetical protein
VARRVDLVEQHAVHEAEALQILEQALPQLEDVDMDESDAEYMNRELQLLYGVGRGGSVGDVAPEWVNFACFLVILPWLAVLVATAVGAQWGSPYAF